MIVYTGLSLCYAQETAMGTPGTSCSFAGVVNLALCLGSLLLWEVQVSYGQLSCTRLQMVYKFDDAFLLSPVSFQSEL